MARPGGDYLDALEAMNVKEATAKMDAARETWQQKCGAKTKAEEKLLEELVGLTTPPCTSDIVLGASGSGTLSAVDPSILAVATSEWGTVAKSENDYGYEKIVKALVEKVDNLQRRVKVLERDAGKSEWDKFEELTG